MLPDLIGGRTNTLPMTNTRLILDALLSLVALATPLFHAAPTATKAVEPSNMATFLSSSGTARRLGTLRTKANRKRAVRGLTYTVTATVYEAVPGQTDAEPFVTADNSKIKPHYGSTKRWMALSRDLLEPWGGKFKYGDKVRVRGISPKLDGVYTVHDTMNRRHRHCMDVLVHPKEELDIYCKDVKIQKVSLL